MEHVPGARSRRVANGCAQQQLLDAAARLFAEQGVDKVSVRAIAEAAGLSHSSVRYHFRSKEVLYKEVLLRYGPKVDRVRIDEVERALHESNGHDDAEVRLVAWITDLLQAVGRPMGISDGLMMQELCREEGPSDELYHASIRPHHEELEGLLAAYRPDWDARTCRVVGIGIIAQAVYFRVARPVAARLLDEECLDTNCADEVSRTLARTILEGVRRR